MPRAYAPRLMPPPLPRCSAFGGYAAGLVTTIVVMNVFQVGWACLACLPGLPACMHCMGCLPVWPALPGLSPSCACLPACLLFPALGVCYQAHNATRPASPASCCCASPGHRPGTVPPSSLLPSAQAAQPALLYIVPGVLGATLIHAAVRGEVRDVFFWHEKEEPHEEGKEKKEEGKEGAAAAEGAQVGGRAWVPAACRCSRRVWALR